MTKGKIVLVRFPFDDLSTTRVRPAVCLTDPVGRYRHIVLAFVTSQKPSHPLPTDIDLPASPTTGLLVPSVLRLHRIMTTPTSLTLRELGRVPPAAQSLIDDAMRDLFQLA